MADSTHLRTIQYQQADGTIQTITERLELLTTFDAYCKGSITDGRTGDLILKVAVPLHNRAEAYVFDEHSGLMFTVKVYRGVPVNGAKVPDELDQWQLEEGEGDD